MSLPISFLFLPAPAVPIGQSFALAFWHVTVLPPDVRVCRVAPGTIRAVVRVTTEVLSSRSRTVRERVRGLVHVVPAEGGRF